MDIRQETRDAAELRAEARATLQSVLELVRATRPSELVEIAKGSPVGQEAVDALWREWLNMVKDLFPKFKDVPVLLIDDITAMLKERADARAAGAPKGQ